VIFSAFGVKVVRNMDKSSIEEITCLEGALAKDPSSEELSKKLLEALSADAEGYNDPRRFELPSWRSSISCRSVR
jgi:hypothetical protein